MTPPIANGAPSANGVLPAPPNTPKIPADLKNLRRLLEPTIEAFDAYFNSSPHSGFNLMLKDLGKFRCNVDGRTFECTYAVRTGFRVDREVEKRLIDG